MSRKQKVEVPAPTVESGSGQGTECPRCGWRLADTGATTVSAHQTSRGQVSYVRCLCGAWLVLTSVGVIAAA